MAANSKMTGKGAAELVKRGPIDPVELMRVRHPHLFSDSSVETALQLSREVLDYHLITLTNRKQETVFEHFARLLSEKEICPNLRPQTGPTGGGDSKVDSEIFPVASELANAGTSVSRIPLKSAGHLLSARSRHGRLRRSPTWQTF